MFSKWAQLGLNQRPIDYESTALTAELWALAESIVPYSAQDVKRKVYQFRGLTLFRILFCILTKSSPGLACTFPQLCYNRRMMCSVRNSNRAGTD